MSRRPGASHRPRPLASLCTPLLLALCISPTSLPAQTPAQKIQEFAATASGYTLRPDLEVGSLQSGRQMLFPVELAVGADYMVVGFCDADCTDMDLTVLDPFGEEMESDLLPDAQPILMVRPEVRGMFQIRVDMVGCESEPCAFAVGILEGEMREDLGPMGQNMEDRLNVFRSELVEEGFTEIGEPESGTLDQDQEIRFSLTLLEGLQYKVAGVCDNDCENLDLVLFGPGGEEVASDRLSDAIPLLAVTPDVGGEHRVAVQMTTCTIEPCGFTVATFVTGGSFGPGGVAVTGNLVLDETHQGTLEEGDQRLREGEYFDEYSVQAETGQTIIVDLRSPDFDTYLILETPGGDQERNDDWGDDTMHSHIEIVAPEAGTYSVLVTSFMAEEVGEYTVQIAVVAGS
jgi:hypothetical protein